MLQNIDLQVLDWRATDIVITSNKRLDSDDDSDDDNNDKQFDYKNSRSYIIKAFGIDEQGSSVSVTITDFQPYFFIRPKKQQVSSVIMKKLQKHITSSLSHFLLEDYIGLNVVSKKEMWGFTNNQYFDFIQIQCKSMMCMKSCAKIVKTTPFCKFNIYESNIEPFIRFLHHKNINPSGWIRLPKNKYSNKKYWSLINEFKKISGHGVLLNTSFNINGMPLVETPEDAIDCFYQSGIDVLVLNNYLIRK